MQGAGCIHLVPLCNIFRQHLLPSEGRKGSDAEIFVTGSSDGQCAEEDIRGEQASKGDTRESEVTIMCTIPSLSYTLRNMVLADLPDLHAASGVSPAQDCELAFGVCKACCRGRVSGRGGGAHPLGSLVKAVALHRFSPSIVTRWPLGSCEGGGGARLTPHRGAIQENLPRQKT